MAVKVGGIHVARSSVRTANEVCEELRVLSGPVDVEDFVVDLVLHDVRRRRPRVRPRGRHGHPPGMVGRKQRRFVVDLEVPPDLVDAEACRRWITEALGQAATIVREYLPRQGRAYPAERLAAEVDTLRERWSEHITTTEEPGQSPR